MTDTEGEVEVDDISFSPSQREFEVIHLLESECPESLHNTCQEEVQEPLLRLLADVALAPPSDDPLTCSCNFNACTCLEVGLQSMQLQLLMCTADDLQDRLLNSHNLLEREILAGEVLRFLFDCRAYFSLVESRARSTMSQLTSLSFDNHNMLLEFSQRLCQRLEQLLLTYTSYNLLSLDESEPNSCIPIVSNFCIGQCQMGQLKMSMFWYCMPTPYLSRLDTGLYKRMRWNVTIFRHDPQQMGGKSKDRDAKASVETEYYFLCYEDIADVHAEADRQSQNIFHCNAVRMWSLGLWVQVTPDPNTENDSDWMMCDVPQGGYQRLLLLGSNEPSSYNATDLMQQLLISQHPTATSACPPSSMCESAQMTPSLEYSIPDGRRITGVERLI